MSKLALTAVFLASLSSSQAFTADLIQGYHEMSRTKQTIFARSDKCSILRIEYRRPYEPHHEFVNHCTSPLDLTPKGSRGSTGRPSSEFSTNSSATQ